MGTFSIITPISVQSNSISPTSTGAIDPLFPASSAQIIAGLIAPGDFLTNDVELGLADGINPSISGLLRFDFDQSTSIISLDGNPAISFNNLPAGFVPLTCIFSLVSFGTQTAGPNNVFLQMDSFTEGPVFQPPILPPYLIGVVSYSPPPTMFDIIHNGCGIRVAFAGSNESVAVCGFSFTGTYDIQSFSWTITNPDIPVKAGPKKFRTPSTSTNLIDNVITITSPSGPPPPDPPALDFTKLNTATPITLKFVAEDGTLVTFNIPLISVTVLTANLLTFLIPITLIPVIIQYYPSGLPARLSISIFANGNGTQFSGSIQLGTLTLLIADGSGIYRIILDKTSDTIYNRDSGYETLNELIMLSLSDEFETEDFFRLLEYPYKILANENDEEEIDPDLFSVIGILQGVVTTFDIKIPNPFIETGYIGT